MVDAGLSRTAAFDVQSGLSRLVTTLTSRASAEQRAGRAGRLGPGRCYRLYTSLGQQQRPEQTPPEITGAAACAPESFAADETPSTLPLSGLWNEAPAALGAD